MRRPHAIGDAATALLVALAEGPLSRAEAKARLGLDWRQMTNAARALARRGFLVGDAGPYALTPEGVEAAAAGVRIAGGEHGRAKIVRDTLRERAWSAMRVRKSFTVGDLVADAARGDEGRPHDNLRRYLARLSAVGIVQEEVRRQPGTAVGSNGFKRFRLIRNPGPKAPVWRADTSVVHDPNTGADLPCSRP